MATAPSKPIKTVTINYTDPAPGGTHQLQILNDVAGNVGELQFKGKSGRFDATNNLAWNGNSQTLTVRGSIRLTGNILGNIQGNPSYLKIIGGNVGDVLATDGAGNLSWQTMQEVGGYGNTEVANYMPTYLPTYSGNIGVNTVRSTPNANLSIASDNATFITVNNANIGNAKLYGFLPNVMVLPGDLYFNNTVGAAADISTANEKDIDLYTNGFLGNSVEVWLRHNIGVEITTNTGNHVWSFDKTGNLTLPTNKFIIGDGGYLSNITVSYNNLTDKPTIPTRTSDITNDSTYVTLAEMQNYVNSVLNIDGGNASATSTTTIDGGNA